MFRSHFLLLLPVFAFVACAGCGSSEEGPVVPVLHMQESGTDALLIGLHAVSDHIVWAAGTGGSYAWTEDGGATWHAGTVPGADSLQFRDVHAMSLDTAWLLSIGSGEDSRIYRTVDRGASWEMLFRNRIDEAFFRLFRFSERRISVCIQRCGGRAVSSPAYGGRRCLACAASGNAPARTAG